MSPRDFGFLFALVLLSPVAAQEPITASLPAVRFRAAGLGREVLLRDGGWLPAPAHIAPPRRFSLPPGGPELELQPTTFTPYDRYFGSVRDVVSQLEPHGTTMAAACHLMKIGFSFQYVTRDPYRPDPPKLTEVKRAGDCKSKALWLYENLADAGALFAIGKAERNSRTSHAWVYWRSGGRWWILDCTDRQDPIAADSVAPDRYVPYYSFGKNGTYRHPSTRLSAPPAQATASAPVSERKRTR